MYSAIVALTITVFAVVAYFTVSAELNENLDASLGRVASSLQAVIKKEQTTRQRPLVPDRRPLRKRDEGDDDFAFLREGSMRDFVGPVLPVDTGDGEDPVWTAVYEHLLFNSSTYFIQVADRAGNIVWRSDNLKRDSLPVVRTFESHGAVFDDGRFYTYYIIQGVRYRMMLLRGDGADVTVAYAAGEIDATLRRLFSLMVWSMPVAFIVSVLAGWFLARRSLRPVDEITKSARRITARNLGQRLPVPASNDEIARLTDTLNDMIARLETSFDRIRQFTSDASHELKTPLAILMGELEVALRRPLTEAEVQETLRSCLEEVERLTKVVQGLLELSRADTGQLVIEFRPVRFSTLVENIADDVIILADQRHITVIASVEPNIAVDGDAVRLHQALLNVMENAVKYTADGGRVEVTAHADGEAAVVEIRDTGVGIAAHHLPNIFDRFYRVDQARSQRVTGTGLGLAITKWIIDAHNGSIVVASQTDVGTTVTIRLPLRHGRFTS